MRRLSIITLGLVIGALATGVITHSILKQDYATHLTMVRDTTPPIQHDTTTTIIPDTVTSHLPTATSVLLPCPPEGSAKDSLHRQANVLKNRSILPTVVDTTSFDFLLSLDPYGQLDTFAIYTEGYIIEAKSGEAESCNCKGPLRDIHIVFAPTPTSSVEKWVIAEISPRSPLLILKQVRELAKNHAHVGIMGYLFNDSEHLNASCKSNPTGKHLWRGTTWEVHPVLAIVQLPNATTY